MKYRGSSRKEGSDAGSGKDEPELVGLLNLSERLRAADVESQGPPARSLFPRWLVGSVNLLVFSPAKVEN